MEELKIQEITELIVTLLVKNGGQGHETSIFFKELTDFDTVKNSVFLEFKNSTRQIQEVIQVVFG